VGAIGVEGIPLYVKRMKAAVKTITDGKGELGVRIAQLVRLLLDGEPVKMSKSAVDFATLRAVIDEVGRDVHPLHDADAVERCALDGSAFGLAPGGGNHDSLWIKDFGIPRPSRNALG